MKEELPKGLAMIERTTHVMDNLIRIPGTRFRFGLDAVLGLIPGLGDTAGAVISGTLLLTMIRHGVSSPVLLQMIGNILLDYLVGIIPLVGDIFDASFKANSRNLELLKKHYRTHPSKQKKTAALKAVGQVALVVGAVLLITAGAIGSLFFLFA